MRLIGEWKDEKAAYGFQAFLLSQKIESSYEPFQDPGAQTLTFRIWIVNEDDYDQAMVFFREFQENPSDPRFAFSREAPVPLKVPPKWKVRVEMPPQTPRWGLSMTGFFILVCACLFFLNTMQELQVVRDQGSIYNTFVGTPIEEAALFDYPQYRENFKQFLEIYPIKEEADLKNLPPDGQACLAKLQNYPQWLGFSQLALTHDWKGEEKLPDGTLFGKIRQGEYWRLITPIFLHGGILHILFNMMIVWVFGKQIENRIGKFRLFCMVIVIGVVTNVAQYLMTGPLFYGFSGVAVGMGGFIWMRQRIAPWEGYPIHPSSLLSLGLFVMIIWALDFLLMTLQFFGLSSFQTQIANTAHIGGGLLGILFGRLSLFARRGK